MTHTYNSDRDEVSKITSRSLGIISNIQDFCRKQGLSCRTIRGSEDPLNLMIEALDTMVLKNEFKRVGETDELYIRMKVYIDDKKVLTGYFTTEQINAIKSINNRLTLK